MTGISSKIYTLGNTEGKGETMVKPTSEKGVEKIYVRKGATTIFHKLYDKIKGIKVAPSQVSDALKANKNIKENWAKNNFSETFSLDTGSGIDHLKMGEVTITFSSKDALLHAKNLHEKTIKDNITNHLNKELNNLMERFDLSGKPGLANEISILIKMIGSSAALHKSMRPAEGPQSLPGLKAQLLEKFAEAANEIDNIITAGGHEKTQKNINRVETILANIDPDKKLTIATDPGATNKDTGPMPPTYIPDAPQEEEMSFNDFQALKTQEFYDLEKSSNTTTDK